MEEHMDETASFLSTDEGDLTASATNYSHELDGSAFATDGNESIELPLADDDDEGGEQAGEEGEDENGEKRPPVLSRIASGMRKSLTNLFSIFSSGPVENAEEEEIDESGEGSYEEGEEDHSHEGNEEEEEGSVEDAEQNGESVEEPENVPHEEVEIHSLLLDDAAPAPAVAHSPAPVVAQQARKSLSPVKMAVTSTVTEVVQTVEQHVHKEATPTKQHVVISDDSDAEDNKMEEEEEEEDQQTFDQSYVDEMEKRLRKLTKNELTAQLKKRGERAYGLKEELVVRLRDVLLKEEGKDINALRATENGSAASKRGRGEPKNGDEEATEQKPVRVAKRRKVAGAEAEPSSAPAVESKAETVLTWPSLVPTQLPRAYEPSCGWGALPFNLPDPAKAHEWDLENDEDLRNKVALLRLWVLSQPINLGESESDENPTFFEALSEWDKPARETKKAERERLQSSHGLWVYGMEEPPHLPTLETKKRK